MNVLKAKWKNSNDVITPSVNILPPLCPSSLLVDLGIFSLFVVFLSRVLEFLLSSPLSSPSSLLLLSAPGVTALCLIGELGYWPGEHGDWIRLLHDLDLNYSTEDKVFMQTLHKQKLSHIQSYAYCMRIQYKNLGMFVFRPRV